MERRKDSERRQEKRGQKRRRVGNEKNKRHPRNELFGTAVPALCCCGDSDFAQPLAPVQASAKTELLSGLGHPLVKPL